MGSRAPACLVLTLGWLTLACDRSPPPPVIDSSHLDTVAVALITGELGLGLTAVQADSTTAAIRHLGRAHALNPGSDLITYLLAYANALSGDQAAAGRWLAILAAERSCVGPEPGGWSGAMDTIPALAEALAAVRDSAPDRHPSRVAFTLADRALFPEGIAYDSVTGAIFLSSLRRRLVLRVMRSPSGEVTATPFAGPPRDALWSVLGLHVDAARRRLWVVTSAEGFAERERAAELGHSAVLVFDLDTGRPMQRFPLAKPPDRLANDVALDRSGIAYVTDTESGAIYRIDLSVGSAQRFFQPGAFAQPNGIVVTPDNRGLLVADGSNGLWYVDVASRVRHRVSQPPGPMPLFLDGLAWHGLSLIGVSHTLSRGRVLRFEMSAGYDGITAAEILDCQHPLYRQPTTGVVAGDTLFYIATSQFTRVPPPDRPVPTDSLSDIVVMRLSLTRK